MPKPEACPKCGAEAVLRRTCPKCGEGEWVIHHGVHYLQGAREVFVCPARVPIAPWAGERQPSANARPRA
jgi:ribosomal protein S27AE